METAIQSIVCCLLVPVTVDWENRLTLQFLIAGWSVIGRALASALEIRYTSSPWTFFFGRPGLTWSNVWKNKPVLGLQKQKVAIAAVAVVVDVVVVVVCRRCRRRGFRRQDYKIARRWILGSLCSIGYSEENLKIHTGVPSPPFPPLPSLPLLPLPCLPLPLPPSPPFLYPLPLEVGSLKSS